ncbi:MAG: hypothetical protein AB2705_16965 [Candidatus Thiodiazotropha sp.]
MTAFLAFHILYKLIYTKASGKFAVAGIDKNLVSKSYTDSDIVKMVEQAVLSAEKFSENDFNF